MRTFHSNLRWAIIELSAANSRPKEAGDGVTIMKTKRDDHQRRKKSWGLLLIAALSLGGPLYAKEVSAPSVVRAQEQATLSTLIPGRIISMPFETGESFLKGDVLLEIDCAIYRSHAAAAQAERLAAVAQVEARENLFRRGGIGQLEVDVAKAEAAAATAQAHTADIRVGYCQVRAPYVGRVVEHVVNSFEFVEPGQPVLSIVSTGEPDLEIIAPAEWLRWITPGTKGVLRLEATQREVGVSVTSIGATVDPVSRTVKLKASFEEGTNDLLPGLSGLVSLEQP